MGNLLKSRPQVSNCGRRLQGGLAEDALEGDFVAFLPFFFSTSSAFSAFRSFFLRNSPLPSASRFFLLVLALLFAAGCFLTQAAGCFLTQLDVSFAAWRRLPMDGSGWYGAFVLREFAGEALVRYRAGAQGIFPGLLKAVQLISVVFEKIWYVLPSTLCIDPQMVNNLTK